MIRPLFRCRLCWRVTFAVFALILTVESVPLVPSTERFLRTERQRLADHAQILIDPALTRAAAEGVTPVVSPLMGHHGLRAVTVYGPSGDLLSNAGSVLPQPISARSTMAAPLASPAGRDTLLATWRSKHAGSVAVVAELDASGLWAELTAHLVRIAGLIAVIVIVVTIGSMVVLDVWVLREACAQVRRWRDRYGRSPPIAMNHSARPFILPDLLERIEEIRGKFNIPSDLFEFEITETTAMADAVKINKSCVDHIGSDRHAEAICDAILRLGQSLGVRIVAEGVEREDQAAFLQRRHCDQAQGYLFGKPMPAAEFEKPWLAEPVAA